MTDELQGSPGRAVELLELHDRLDLRDDELRVQKIVLRVTPLVSTVLAAPLLIVLFLNEVRFFVAYPTAFIVVLGAVLYALKVERRRRKAEREAIRARIRQIEDAPPPLIECHPTAECDENRGPA
jgi:Na+/H+ antiporter NhaD/arsenite permease-like protein